MQVSEIQEAIKRNIVMRNPEARYRLSTPIIGYRRMDIPKFHQGLIVVPGFDVDIDMVQSLLYKTVAGMRFYYRIVGDYIKLYVESQGLENPEVTDDILEELSNSLNFAYNHADVDAILCEMDNEEAMVFALTSIGMEYNVIGLERKGETGNVHLAVQDSKSKKIYDKYLGITGVTVDEYLEKVKTDYWIDQDLKRKGDEEIYDEE